MKVTVEPRGGPGSKLFDITITLWPGDLHHPQALSGLLDHDLRDLEFALAQRRAMSRHCDATTTRGGMEHACLSPPGHGPHHACRSCHHTWIAP